MVSTLPPRSWRAQPGGDGAGLAHQWAAGLTEAGSGRGACPAPLTPPGPAGESIPIRLFLAGYELTPTMRDINKKFSVRYYLNLVLIDDEERRYFKQQVGPWGAGRGRGRRRAGGRGRGRAGGCLCCLVHPKRRGKGL